jgi:hypothetical protein
MRVKGNAVCIMMLLAILQGWAQFYPQNARMEALGGTFIIDDRSDILRYPVCMDQYKDGMQATWNSAILGVKSVGDVLCLGITANRGLMMDNSYPSSFYQTAATWVNALGSADAMIDPIASVRAMPHILVGADLSVVALGFDVFWEHSGLHFSNETAAADIQMDAGINNFGTIASARFGVGNIPIMAKFGISFPGVSAKYDNETAKTEVGSDKGLFLNFGGETDIPVGDFTVSAGLDLLFENYGYTLNDSAMGSYWGNNKMAFYGGIQGEAFTNAQWGAQYTLAILDSNGTTPTDTLKRRNYFHIISCGIENKWSTVWKFDECILRSGLQLNITTTSRTGRDGVNEFKHNSAVAYNTVIPTIGGGLRKGFFQLDLTINPTVWAGVVSGPQVGRVTATMQF